MSGRLPTILAVDDEEATLTVVRKLLEAENCKVEVSHSAREALEKLRQTSFDAVLCDMWMPGMSGREFYQQVMKDFPHYEGHFVFMTADAASEATWGFIDEKDLPYVMKPFSRAELQRKLRLVIGDRLDAASEGQEKVNQRRDRRISIRTRVRVRRKKFAVGGPDIAPLLDASRKGVLFLTEREYWVGTEVLVAFPYPDPNTSNPLEQEGIVVRVEERKDGLWRIAVALR
ncbi:MAG: response regulator [Acidobacteria bacterium]|nr:response regulator [Acidobacteriota bacterium]